MRRLAIGRHHPDANWIYRLIERLAHEPLMAGTRPLALISTSLSKDDRTDAERLA